MVPLLDHPEAMFGIGGEEYSKPYLRKVCLMRWTITLSLAAVVLARSAAMAGTILEDDFEAYADDAAMQAAWNEGGGGGGTLDTGVGNPGQSMAHPGGLTSKRLFTATTPTDVQPLVWEFDFMDDGTGNKRVTGGLRDNGGGAPLNSILEMGRYNALADPEAGGLTVSGYGVRTVFIGGSPGDWVTFAGNPSVQAGWHHFRATIRTSDILFELDLGDDGTVDATRMVATSGGAGIGYNVSLFGGPSNLSSAGGGAHFDNLSIQQVPEPTSAVLLGVGGISLMAIALRRRCRTRRLSNRCH